MASEAKKTCRRCGKKLPLSEFYPRHNDKYMSHDPRCKRCERFRRFRRVYRLSESQFNKLLARNRGKCHICGAVFDVGIRKAHTLCVDHVEDDDGNVYVRGLLCHKCNTAIGLLSDDPTIMVKAARYVCENGTNKRKAYYRKAKKAAISLAEKLEAYIEASRK